MIVPSTPPKKSTTNIQNLYNLRRPKTNAKSLLCAFSFKSTRSLFQNSYIRLLWFDTLPTLLTRCSRQLVNAGLFSRALLAFPGLFYGALFAFPGLFYRTCSPSRILIDCSSSSLSASTCASFCSTRVLLERITRSIRELLSSSTNTKAQAHAPLSAAHAY